MKNSAFCAAFDRHAIATVDSISDRWGYREAFLEAEVVLDADIASPKEIMWLIIEDIRDDVIPATCIE